MENTSISTRPLSAYQNFPPVQPTTNKSMSTLANVQKAATAAIPNNCASFPRFENPYANLPPNQPLTAEVELAQERIYDNIPSVIQSNYANLPPAVSDYANLPPAVSDYANLPPAVSDYANLPKEQLAAPEVAAQTPTIIHPELTLMWQKDDQAGALYTQKKYTEAIQIQQEILETKRKWLEPSLKTEIASTLNSLGVYYAADNKHAEARKAHEEALQIRVSFLGEHHSDVAVSYNNLGSCDLVLEKYAEAGAFFMKALEIWRAASTGSVHPAMVASALNNIGICYSSGGQYQDAITFHQQALDMWLKSPSAEYMNIASAQNNIGSCLRTLKKHKQALASFKAANQILKNLPETNPVFLATVINNVASAYFAQDKFKKAFPFFDEAINLRSQALGENHSVVARTWDQKGLNLSGLHEYKAAIDCFDRAGKIWLALAEYHKRDLDASEKQAYCYSKLKNPLAQVYYQHAYQKCKRLFGDKDKRTTRNHEALIAAQKAPKSK